MLIQEQFEQDKLDREATHLQNAKQKEFINSDINKLNSFLYSNQFAYSQTYV